MAKARKTVKGNIKLTLTPEEATTFRSLYYQCVAGRAGSYRDHIGAMAHFVFGLERNQQADDEEERGRTTFRVLKDRKTGRVVGNPR